MMSTAYASKDYSWMTPQEKEAEITKEKMMMHQASATSPIKNSTYPKDPLSTIYWILGGTAVLLYVFILIPRNKKSKAGTQ